jgi:DNA-directed RNA polymerase specialized sigma24 family protein
MNIPKNMTREEVIEKIELVVGRIAPKYAFHGYDVDDIKQEAFIICMDALDRYDQKRPLENFLSVNLSNRLKNFVRDNFFVGQDENKRNVLCPKQLTFESSIAEECDDNLDRKIDFNTLQSLIDEHLPSEYRADYLKILSDVYISKKRREHIIEVIKGIIDENG